jgi:hypothetical protein
MKVYRWLAGGLGVIVVALGVILALNALTYVNFDPAYGFLKLKQKAIATGWYLPAYYSHVLVSACILLIGFFQLSKFGRKWIRIHRYLGYFYVMGILFFAAPGGLVMSLFINRGPWVQASFFMQGSMWILFTALAFDRIRKRNIESHREWMWRSFSLTAAAITLRIYIYICSWFVDLSEPTAYAILSWMSWVPNLAGVEFFLRKTRGAIRPSRRPVRVPVMTEG